MWRSWTLAGLVGLALAVIGTDAAGAQEAAARATLTVHADRPGPKVNREIFGQFTEHLGEGIYGGIWVGPESKIPNTSGFRNDVLAAVKAIRPPVIRWPGGCFADQYRWRDGIGPTAARPVTINTTWGGVTESNRFGTHEFMQFAELVGAQPYVSANVGSAPPAETQQWVEYMTEPGPSSLAQMRRANGRDAPWKVPFVGLGNELWGCGGQMRAEYAADVTRRYAAFIKQPAGQHILKIASGADSSDLNWTEVMMRVAGEQIDGLGLHYYTLPTGDWDHKGSATQFAEADWTRTLAATLRMDELIAKHAAIMDKYDPKRRVWLAVDEWGAWYDAAPGSHPGFLRQDNSLRDALVAAINFDIFTAHAERVKMANISQMVNVLQALILTRGDRMVLTPTYYVFAMYLPWQDAQALPIELTTGQVQRGQWSTPAVHASAVKDAKSVTHIALVNLDPAMAAQVTARIDGPQPAAVKGQILTAAAITAGNDFDHPDQVRPRPFDGAKLKDGTLEVALPARSVVVLDLGS
jgi:alpha-N-arabinofuranosidase